MTDTVAHCQVLQRARSNDARFPWVLLCELADGSGCFSFSHVVWYEDESERRSAGYYTSSWDDARAEFERRTGIRDAAPTRSTASRSSILRARERGSVSCSTRTSR